MSQMKLESFFKFKVSKTLKFENDNIIDVKSEMETPPKRSRKSLKIPSPFKTPKLEENEIINLISDEEETSTEPEQFISDSTIAYTPEDQSPNTSSSSGTNNVRTTLNLKTSHESSIYDSMDISQNVDDISMSPTSSNSLSAKKYFSPHKKRSLTVKTHTKVRKNLSNIISECNNQDLQHFKGLDDKTKFLVKIIYQCLNDKNLILLLDENSQSLLKKCMNLSNDQGSSIQSSALHLVCRLYWRKEGWYRVKDLQKIVNDKKNHNENVDLQPIFDCLLQNGMLVTTGRNVISFDEYYELLNISEVKAICKEFKIKFKSKEAAKSLLQNFSNQKSIGNYFGMSSLNNSHRILQSMRTSCGVCYKLSGDARRTFYELYILMYLGIERSILMENKLELMLITDKANRETYPVGDLRSMDNASVVFKNRHEFQSYIVANKIYEEFLKTSDTLVRRGIVENVYKQYMDISKDDMTSYKCLPVWLRQFTPAYLYIKILESGLPDLKKQPDKEKYCQLAVEILTVMVSQNQFRQHKKAEWYSEMALIYDKCLNNPNKAAETVLNAFGDPELGDYQKECLRTRARMLTNRVTNKPAVSLVTALTGHALQESLEKDIHAKHISKHPMESSGRGKRKFERRLSHGIEVMEAEEYCKMYYIEQGKYTHGEHWEGAIITTIFTLLFWDIIYAELRGVRGIFLTRYQRYPLDMFTEAFYSNRKCLIEELLNDIETKCTTDLIDTMKNVWDSRPENELSDIQRGKNMSWEKVATICKCLGSRSLAAICRRLAMDYRYSHSGFPDLTLWNPSTNQIIFVEVKTDTDSASIKQIQWMKYLQCNNIETEFCYIGTNTTRSNSRNNEN